MKSVIEYLTRKHREILRNRYKTEHCGVIALEAAQRLLAEGERPQIEAVYEERRSGSTTTIVKQVPHFLRG